MNARFTFKNKRWHCTDVWEIKEKYPVQYLSLANGLYLDVTKKPPLGTCKRPHYYAFPKC